MNEPLIHVLLIDTDISYAKTAPVTLKKFQGIDFKITWEETGAGGIERLEDRFNHRAVLVDYSLSEMTALELAKEIRDLKLTFPLFLHRLPEGLQAGRRSDEAWSRRFFREDEIVESVLPRTLLNVLEPGTIEKTNCNGREEQDPRPEAQ